MVDELSSLPKVTRWLVVGLPCGYVAALLGGPRLLTRLALVPAHTFLLRAYPWVFATGFLVENNALLLCLALATLVSLGSRVESDWGAVRFASLIAVALLSSSVATVAVCAVLYGRGHMALFQCFTGFLPGVMAIAVAAWQRCPDEIVLRWPALFSAASGASGSSGSGGGLRARQLPFALVAFALVYEAALGPSAPSEVEALAMAGGEDAVLPGSDTLPALAGWYFSWLYLRFAANSGAGDPSPAFAFAAQFPGPLRIAAGIAGAAAFPLARLCGYGAAVAEAAAAAARNGPEASDAQRTDTIEVLPRTGGGGAAAAVDDSGAELKPLPGSTALEANRRRQAALAALAERLERQQPQQPPSQTGRSSTPPPHAGGFGGSEGTPTATGHSP